MSPRRSPSHPHPPAQRRPRTGRACTFCRRAKQRCEPSKYGTNDRPCRRCVSHGLECSIARSQSPNSGFGAQGPGSVQHPIAPHSAGGAAEEMALGSESNVQYVLQQSEPLQAPVRRWSPLMMGSDERQGSSTTPLQTRRFSPLAPNMEGYLQSFRNAAQGSANLDFSYYSQEYYGQTSSCDTYMTSYAAQDASDGAPNFGYVMEESHPDNTGAFANEEDASLSRSDEC